MDCWICGELSHKNNVCDCENDFSYVHNHCIEKMVSLSDNKECRFCKKKYKIRIVIFTITQTLYFVNWFLFELIDFYQFLTKFDLESGLEWEERYF